MKISLSDVCKIRKGEIELDRITVIAGSNDSGKSTVGKMLFSIFNGSVTSDEMYTHYLSNQIEMLLNSFTKYADNEEMYVHTKHLKKESQHIIENKKKLPNYFFKELKEYLMMAHNYKRSPYMLNKMKKLLLELEEYSDDKKSFENIAKNVIQKNLESCFDGSIKRFASRGESHIKITQNNKQVVKLAFTNSGIKKFFFSQELAPTLPDDAVLFESPTILDFTDAIKKSITGARFSHSHYKKDILFDEPVVSTQSKDLISKLTRSTRKSKFIKKDKKVASFLQEVIGGYIEYDDNIEKFVFRKGNTIFSMSSTATGIKTFGCLSLLLQSGYINNKSILILDEPEVHLHPEWQLKLATFLVDISQDFEIPILLSSHSPYFVEAIDSYSRKSNYRDKVNFYFHKTNKNAIDIIDCKEDLSLILDGLAKPLDQIDSWYNDV